MADNSLLINKSNTEGTGNLAGYKVGDIIRLGTNGKYYKVVKQNGKLVLKLTRTDGDLAGKNAIHYNKDGIFTWQGGQKVPIPKGFSSKYHIISKGTNAHKVLTRQLFDQRNASTEAHYAKIDTNNEYKRLLAHIERNNLSDNQVASFYYKVFDRNGDVKNNNFLIGDRSMYNRALAARRVLENRGIVRDYDLGWKKLQVQEPNKNKDFKLPGEFPGTRAEFDQLYGSNKNKDFKLPGEFPGTRAEFNKLYGSQGTHFSSPEQSKVDLKDVAREAAHTNEEATLVSELRALNKIKSGNVRGLASSNVTLRIMNKEQQLWKLRNPDIPFPSFTGRDTMRVGYGSNQEVRDYTKKSPLHIRERY